MCVCIYIYMYVFVSLKHIFLNYVKKRLRGDKIALIFTSRFQPKELTAPKQAWICYLPWACYSFLHLYLWDLLHVHLFSLWKSSFPCTAEDTCLVLPQVSSFFSLNIEKSPFQKKKLIRLVYWMKKSIFQV